MPNGGGAVCDATSGEPATERGACSDQVDNDCDGFVDCEDPDDCAFLFECTGCTSEPVPLDASGRLIHGDAPPLTKLDPGCGKLSYGYYANEGRSNQVDHLLPDFSYAGYMKGGVAIPDIPVVRTLDPRPGDNWGRIQDAIDWLSDLPPDANGFRGALLLRRGDWEVSRQLRIAASGIVLRGEGQGADGTVLISTQPFPEPPKGRSGSKAVGWFIWVGGHGTTFEQPKSGSPIARITDGLVPVGSRTFSVTSTDGFAVGDTIAVRRTPNARWIEDLGMNDLGVDDEGNDASWKRESFQVAHERTITQIEGSSITVDIPLVDAIEVRHGGGEIFLADLSGRVSQVGIEDLRIRSFAVGSEGEDHAWVGVALERTYNSWVRRVTTLHFAMSAVRAEWASFNTIEEVAFLSPTSQNTGGRRYPFHASLGSGNLFQRCFAEEARHSFATSGKSPGPNVWLDCLAIDPQENDGPHEKWATGLLFDNTRSGTFDVENRANAAGWTGAQTLFWNIYAQPLGFGEHSEGTGVRCDAPVGAMNWAVGVIGERMESQSSPLEPFGIWESLGTRVEPRSLYLKQLEDRLGVEAVEAVTIPEQRSGTIWSMLRAWAGQSTLASVVEPYMRCKGVRSGTGTTCCAGSCGTCGGDGCSQRPGGAAACCSSSIQASGLSCIDYPPPCVMLPFPDGGGGGGGATPCSAQCPRCDQGSEVCALCEALVGNCDDYFGQLRDACLQAVAACQ